MKLALVTPKGVFFGKDSELANFFREIFGDATNNMFIPKYVYWSGGNLGLLIVAALTPSDFEINFLDENYEEINFDVGYDLVGITAMTQQATRAYEIADEFRRRGVKVVIGGIHATVLPEEAKEHADSVVIGEAENTWPEFINDFHKGEIKSFYKNTEPVDLARSPLPRYDLLKKYDYKMIWVQTTRGCPRDCDFCSASKVYGRTFRHKNIEQVMDELYYISGIWGSPLISFADDNMFVDKKYAHELIGKLQHLRLRWTAQTDVSAADDEVLLTLLEKNGCNILFIGFETLSQDNRIDTHGWKQNRIQKYPDIIQKIQSRGIGILGAFIVGLDGDDPSVFSHLSNFIIDNRLYSAQITVLTPLPGTRLRERLIKESRILSSEWSGYTFVDVNYMPKKMTPEVLKHGLMEVYRQVYSKETRLAVMKHFKEIYGTMTN